ncbi:MAG: hypothetical protein JSR33_10240, partial [Proteobacteria bacterium]|nr:hypothetical protein [Pseudomonadota bacterium]
MIMQLMPKPIDCVSDLKFAALLKYLERLPGKDSITEEKIANFEDMVISITDLKILEHVAEGVYKAVYQKQIVAVKIADKRNRFERELKALVLLSESKHVLQLKKFGSFIEAKIIAPSRSYFLVTEWMSATLHGLLDSKAELPWHTRLNIA